MENPVSTTQSRVGLVVLGLLALVFVGWIAYSFLTGEETATVQIGGAEAYTVRVADNAMERMRGLSGVNASELSPAIGMLFVYDDQDERTFWMKGMKFDLDFIWIKDGKIVKIDRDIPYPPHGTDPVSVTSAPLAVDMVLEVPAGIADQVGYRQGHELTINLDAE